MARVNWNIEKVKRFVGEESNCSLISESYKNQNTEMDFMCECGNKFTTTWKQFCSDSISKRQCNDCGYARCNIGRTYTIEDINNVLEGSGSEVHSKEYKNIKTPISIRCSCGNIFETIPDYIVNGNRRKCFKCQDKHGNRFNENVVPHNLKSKDDFLKELKELRGEEYRLVSDYLDVKEPIILEHKCGNEWKTNADKVLNAKQECPECYGTANSKLTRVIDCWLNKNNVEHTKEYIFDDCLHEKHLRFDYAIFSKGELQMLIEADGEQHFKPSNLFGGEETFILTQKRDSIKNKYCKDNDIKLLRVPYYEIENVDSILHEYIQDNTEPSRRKHKKYAKGVTTR